MRPQNCLLDTDSAPIPEKHSVNLIALAKAHAINPLQREFARLLALIESTGAQVQTLLELQSQYRLKFAQALPPLKAEQASLVRQTVAYLHARLQRPEAGSGKTLTPSHRKAIGRTIVSLSLEFARQGDEQMRHIHDTYSQETIEQMDTAGLDGVLHLLDKMGLAVDLPKEKINQDELIQLVLKAAQEKMAAQEDLALKKQAKRKQKQAAKVKADSKMQAKQAAKQEVAQEAQNSLRSIYRQLASQLHPDRANDHAQRALNHDLMSQVNAAYERQDLLALLKLQLHAQQIDANAMHAVAEEKLKSWNSLLKAQAKQLKDDAIVLEMQMVHEFRIPAYEKLTDRNLAASLNFAIQAYDETLHQMRNDLERIQDDAFLKRWAKASSKPPEIQDDLQGTNIIDVLMDDLMPAMAPRRTTQRKR